MSVFENLHYIINVFASSYYPLYPPNEEMSIDYENYHDVCVMPVTPHIFITPSEFKQYIKVTI